jgi:ABC-2 type transport system permease protein
MTATAHVPAAPRDFRTTVRQYARILHVVASVDFKLKYADSALGYVWSLVKPLSYFTILWIVFGRFFKLSSFPHFPLFLFIGIVLYTFLVDAIGTSIPSVVVNGSVIRRISFPRLILPMSATLTSGITFLINAGAVVVFIVLSRVGPQWTWFLLPFLIAQLYILILGCAFLLSAAFVRYRDVSQVWELVAQLLFYASPIMYPVGFLPPWFQPIAYLNPFVQILQDTRAVIVGSQQPHGTIASVYGTGWARLLPIAITFAIFGLGLTYFRRRSTSFAEQV